LILFEIPKEAGTCFRVVFRGLRGEDLSVKELSSGYGVSTKSIKRDINDLNAF